MKTSKDLLRMLDSLCYLYREHAECGDLDPITSADIAELMEWMVKLTIGLIGGEAA